MRGAWLEVNINNLISNYRNISNYVDCEDVKKLCVIKANGYSAGAVRIAQELEKENVDYFAVATLDEAIELRVNNVETPILVLGYTPEEDFEKLIQNKVTQTVYDEAEILKLNYCAKKLGKKACIHVKIDTGLGRLGFFPQKETLFTIKRMMGLSNIMIEGIYTHFAVSDCPNDPYTIEQYNRFDEFVNQLRENKIEIPICHSSNSGAVIHFKETALDMVRIGIILYGLSPSSANINLPIELKPILQIKGKIASVKILPVNHSVGYGRTYTTKQKIKAAVIPMGYVDGIPKRYEERGTVLIKGMRCPIIGNICMDQFVVDVSNIEKLDIGDEFVLLGIQLSEKITIEDIAENCNTNIYDIISKLDQRLPKLYTKR